MNETIESFCDRNFKHKYNVTLFEIGTEVPFSGKIVELIDVSSVTPIYLIKDKYGTTSRMNHNEVSLLVQ